MKSFIVAISIIVVCGFGSVTYAQSTSVQSQIDALLAQIAALQAQIQAAINNQQSTTPVSTPAPTTESSTFFFFGQCPSFSRNLQPLMTGPDVAGLQAFLSGNISIYPERLITGYYGNATQRAVQQFQIARGIISSGSPETTGFGAVGPRTRTAILAECKTSPGSNPGTTPTNPTTPTQPVQPTQRTCYTGNATIASGTSLQMFSIQSAGVGSSCAANAQYRTCIDGTLLGDAIYRYPTCLNVSEQASCTVGGITVPSGSSRVFYSIPFVGTGNSCNSYAQSRTCINGVLSGSLNYTYPSCVLDTPSACNVDGLTIAHGTSRTLFSQAVATGTAACSSYSQSRSCTNGSLSGDSKYSKSTCSAGGCIVNGVTLTNGSSTTFYLAQNIPSTEQCSSYAQTRTCTNGTISGNEAYKYNSCSPAGSGTCVLDNAVIANGGAGTFYSSTVAPAGQTCSLISRSRTCTNGVLSGSATYNRATCTDTQSCTLNGVTVSHGSSAIFYSASTVAYGSTCSGISQSRTCNNGSLSGSAAYQYGSCSVNPPGTGGATNDTRAADFFPGL